MNRIQQLFSKKTANILNIYCTAGYPEKTATVPIIQALDRAGVDLIEIGMPYSDPLADGPTIQESNGVALRQGMSIPVLLDQLENIRSSTQVPLLLMGYLNPVLQYGMEAFLKRCAHIGIDGLILPDLPLQIYQQDYQALFESYGIALVFLVTPQTSEARIRAIDNLSNAFIYAVSSAATTGKQRNFGKVQEAYFERLNAMQLKSPVLIGFGISNHQTYVMACQYAQGAIVGSAFIRMLKTHGYTGSHIEQFVQSIREPALQTWPW